MKRPTGMTTFDYKGISDVNERDQYIDHILGSKDSWSLIGIIQKLIETSDILLIEKDYDGHGHEVLKEARDQAVKKLNSIKQ